MIEVENNTLRYRPLCTSLHLNFHFMNDKKRLYFKDFQQSNMEKKKNCLVLPLVIIQSKNRFEGLLCI